MSKPKSPKVTAHQEPKEESPSTGKIIGASSGAVSLFIAPWIVGPLVEDPKIMIVGACLMWSGFALWFWFTFYSLSKTARAIFIVACLVAAFPITRLSVEKQIAAHEDNSHRIQEIIRGISALRDDGLLIQLQCEGSQKLRAGETTYGNFKKWCEKVQDYIRKQPELNYKEYQSWFEDTAKHVVLVSQTMKPRNQWIWSHVEKRKRNLTEMIEEMRRTEKTMPMIILGERKDA